MQTIILLHGALGSAEQMQPLKIELEKHYKVYSFTFSGHGSNPLLIADFSMSLFASDTINFMEVNKIDVASFVGYSMGGYVAMYIAKLHPEKVKKIITLGTKFYWDETVAAKQTQMFNPETIQLKVPALAQHLKNIHGKDNWQIVLQKTSAMLSALGKNNVLHLDDYASIENESLIMLGDRDNMVSLEETVQVYKKMLHAEMAVLPGTPHPIEKTDPVFICKMISRFL